MFVSEVKIITVPAYELVVEVLKTLRRNIEISYHSSNSRAQAPSYDKPYYEGRRDAFEQASEMLGEQIDCYTDLIKREE